MQKAIITPSMMCANFGHLADELKALEACGAQYLHIDIMDGHFVPNFTLGPDFVRALRKLTRLPMDIHLMVENPQNHIAAFDPQPGDMLSVHQEATAHLQRTLAAIRAYGATAGVALNPATPLCCIEEVLDDIGMVLIMTVNPGFAGQKLVPQTIDKIRRTRMMIDRVDHPILLQVDGNVSFENARLMRQAGAEMFVAGSSSVFDRSMPMKAAFDKLWDAVR